ncbi:MAG: hypothetical protein RLZZ440_1516 [Planctomycetota bacterium]
MTTAASPLLIVTVDRLPAWLLPPWGCTWSSMPTLTSLAARGVVFDRCLATSDDPAATLTVLGGGGPAVTGPGGWPLLAAACEAGLAPVFITDDPDLAAGADNGPTGPTIVHVPMRPAETAAADEAATNLGRLFAAAAERLASSAHRLVWCHAASLGETWDMPAEYREAYLDPDDPPPPAGTRVPNLMIDAQTDPDLIVAVRHVFAGQLTLLDHCLGRLVEGIPHGGRGWAILVAGVRGLGLGLHGRLGPGPMPPFGELIHLPAIVVDPAGRMAAQRVGGLITPADLAATLLEAAGRPAPQSADPRLGRSLMPLLHDWTWPGRDRVICSAVDGTAVATAAWLLVSPSAAGSASAIPRLFAKPDDFFELSDVADRCPAVAEELSALAATDPDDAWTRPLSPLAAEGV